MSINGPWLSYENCHECGCDPAHYDELVDKQDREMSDIQSTNAVIEGESSSVTFGEFWHIAPSDGSFAGPFTTKEAAEADARTYLQDECGRYGIDSVTIVKTVARGENTITVETNFHDV